MSSSQQLVSFEQQGAIGHIVLDNPPENRINREFYAQLGRSARQALRAGCRAVLIRSAGPDFSLGGDFTEWPSFQLRLPEFFVEYLFLSPAELPENRRFRPAVSRLERYFLCEKGEGEFSHRLAGRPSMACGPELAKSAVVGPSPTMTAWERCLDCSTCFAAGPKEVIHRP